MTASTRMSPPTTSGTNVGRIVWHDLLTTDIRRSVEFYTKLVGWKTTDFQGGEKPYTMWTIGNGENVGGVMPLPDEARAQGDAPHWMFDVGVRSCDESHALAVKLGAKSHVPPTDIPGIGRFAVLLYPQGIAFAIFEHRGGGALAPEGTEIGTFSWHELITTDYKAALEFYGKVCGWEQRSTFDMGPMGTYLIWGRKGNPAQLGGMMNRAKEAPDVGWTSYIRVPDVDKAAKDIKQLGGRLVHDPVEVPGGDRIVKAFDPQGAPFALHWVKPK